MRLTKKEFRAWLDANRRRVVGTSITLTLCPIAQFIKTTTGKRPTVSSACIGFNGKNYPPPKWATAFINNLDDASNKRSRSIRGATALKILDSI